MYEEIISKYGIYTDDWRLFRVLRPIDAETYKDLRRNHNDAIVAELKAAHVAEKTTLPTLAGSEKQIKWADEIRSRFFASVYFLRQIPDDMTFAEMGQFFSDTAKGAAFAITSFLCWHDVTPECKAHWAAIKEAQDARRAELQAAGKTDEEIADAIQHVYYKSILATGEETLQNETHARYWIDRR